MSIEELLTSLETLPEEVREDVRNNGGGHFNHSLLWKVLCPPGKRSPAPQLNKVIQQAFGDLDTFKKQFNERAEKLFGSGYVWLCADGSGKLVMKSMRNQDGSLSKGLTPLFLMDLWEHAYYLKHQNCRTEYIEAFWNVVNWDEVSQRYDEVG